MIPEISLDPAMKPITFNEMMHWAMWNVCDHTRLGNPSIAKTPHRFSPCFASPCLPTPYCLPKREKQSIIPSPTHSILSRIQLISGVSVLYSDCTPYLLVSRRQAASVCASRPCYHL
jgi:hypothetical protein